ncbi:phosphatase PAP2 family protein [Candidatus Roizmanbacteria bacterium]|nr:phosphatase PAP2 family protein [Candidatus Roizmanbacteria bacterium]
MNYLQNLDSQLSHLIFQFIPHTSLTDILFSFLSLKGNSIVIWLLLLGILFLFEEKRNKKFLVYFITTFVITSFIVIGIKDVIKRPRPCHVFQPIVSYHCPTDASFPSAHAAAAFASALIFAYFDKKRAGFYYGLAFLIALSRVYFGYHYVGDVVGGGVLGIAVSYIILRNHRVTTRSI